MAAIHPSSETPKEYECPISMGIMRDPVLAKCSHTFERSEIERWLEKNSCCPECRATIDRTDLVSNRVLKSLIQKFIEAQKSIKISGNPHSQKDKKTSDTVLGHLSGSRASQESKKIPEILSSQKGEAISISVHIQGNIVSLEILPEDTIEDVKKKIHSKNGTYSKKGAFWGTLLYNGQRLRDKNKIRDYKIQDGFLLHLVRHMQVYCVTSINGIPDFRLELLLSDTFQDVVEEIKIWAKKNGHHPESFVHDSYIAHGLHVMKKGETLADIGLEDMQKFYFKRRLRG